MESGRLKENSAKLREQILPNLDAFYLKMREGLTTDNEKAIVKQQDSASKLKIEIAKTLEEQENEDLIIENLNEQVSYLEKINSQLSRSISGLYASKNVQIPKPPESQISKEACPTLTKQQETIAELLKISSLFEKRLGMRIIRQGDRITIEYDYISRDRGVHIACLFLDSQTSDFCLSALKPNLPKIQEMLVEFNLSLNFRKFVAKLRKAFCDLYQ